MKDLNFSRLGIVLVALIALWTVPLTAGQPPSPPDGWTDGYVFTNGIRVHYWRTGGDKPVLLLAHGYSDDGLCWVDLAKKLESDYDIIMADARGHGLSDPPSPSDSADAQVEDLAGLISKLNLEKPLVMGHSMGSASAAWFAAKYPDIPRAVILEDPRLIPRPAGASRASANAATLAAQQEKRRLQILARNNTSYDELLAERVTNSPKWSRSECEYWARSKRLHHPNTALRSRSGRPSMNELFSKITAPTLILKADAQGDIRIQNEEVTKLLTSGRIVHVEGAGHCVHRDQMQRALQTLNTFLSEL